MRKQDRLAVRTPEGAVQTSRAELQKFSNCIALTVEGDETTTDIQLKVGDKVYPATIDLRGLVTFLELKTLGATQLHGGNIIPGTIFADLITSGVLRSRDEKSIVLDLDRGHADITGSIRLAKQTEAGELVGALLPDGLQIARMGVMESDKMPEDEQTPQTEPTEPELCVLRQVTLTQDTLAFTDGVSGNSLSLKLESSGGRLTGLSDPQEDSDAVNKAYIDRELAKLRQELGLEAE